MKHLGQHYGFETYYLDISEEDFKAVLPRKNWFCCAIANFDFEDSENSVIDNFVRAAIDRDILAWHGLGQFGEKLHFTFDMIMVNMEVDENHSEIDVFTSGEDDTDLADGFWGCYGAPCLPERTDYETVKLICVSFDGRNYQDELKQLILRFKNGWFPPN